ncbi:WD repeat-containing protein 83 [Dissophora globulifera]|nr:WD repeat-containing protein 83 [Dissophora globulifera]
MPKGNSRKAAAVGMSLAATLAAHRGSTDNSGSSNKKTQQSARKAGGAGPAEGAGGNSSGVLSLPSSIPTSATSLSTAAPPRSSVLQRLLKQTGPSSSASSTNQKSSIPLPLSLPIYEDQIVSDATGAQINACQYNTTGEYILTGGVDRTVRLWNPETRFCIKTYEAHGWEVLDLAISPENGKFASCGGDKTVFLWDVLSGMTIRRFSGHTQRINAVDFDDSGSLLASGSYDATIRLWDCRSQLRAPIQVLEEPKDSVTSIQIQGSNLLAGCVDGSIRIYDIRMGKLTTDNIFEPVTSVSFSKDGNCVLASSLDDTVRLMDLSNGSLLNAYKGHKNSQYKIRSCLSNSDAFVLSGSEDGKIFIWDLIEGEVVHQIEAHSKIVSSIAYHPKEDKMCSASVDGSIKTWTSQPNP